MSIENFKQIDLYQNITILHSYKDCNHQYIYPIHNYYFGFNQNIISIFNENYELILMNDNIISNNYTYIYLSLYNEHLVFQLVYNDESVITIYNKDFTQHGSKYILNTNKQITYIWNNEPILVQYENQSFKLYSTENTLFCEYKLPFIIKGYSNIICLHKNLYMLALLSNDLYVYIKLGENLEFSNYFSIDYHNIKQISIDYYNDICNILILQNDSNLITIKKDISNIFSHKNEKIDYVSIPDFVLQYENKKSIMNTNNLNHLIQKIKKGWVEDIVFDFKSIQRFTPRITKSAEIILEKAIEIPKEIEIPKVIHVKSNRYFDYFKWIVENYDTSENETVVFYNNLQYNINIEFSDNFVVNTLHMDEISINLKTFILTMGKLSLCDSLIYLRKFKKINMYENIVLTLISNENKNDFYVKQHQITQSDLSKMLYFLISNNIKYTRHLYWTPYQYFKLDMKLIWNRSKEYWEKIYQILNKDFSIEKYMPYLFYNIING